MKRARPFSSNNCHCHYSTNFVSHLFFVVMLALLARNISAFQPSVRSAFALVAPRIPRPCQLLYQIANDQLRLERSFHATSTVLRVSRFSPDELDEALLGSNNSGYSRPVVQWYPGHIAKAERMLQETLRAVDVVIEVRDARAAKATSHPSVGAWCQGRPRLVVLTHADLIPNKSKQAWTRAYEQFGAEHPDQAATIDRQIQNQAKQAIEERQKYTLDSRQISSSTISALMSKQKKNSDKSSVATVEQVLFVNAKEGAGIHALTRAIFAAGEHVQERRRRRGLRDRPLRVAVLGYPNTGKSSLLNRLLGRKRARTANTPGVTRSLQWIRVSSGTTRADGSSGPSSSDGKRKEFELLDSPGIIPASLDDQSDATLLAACNCIGDAAYDNQAVAAYLCEWLLSLYRLGYGAQAAPEWRTQCIKRYGFDPVEPKKIVADGGVDSGRRIDRTGEDMLFDVADNTCQGNPEDAARKILQDFRTGRMGLICLQVPPEAESDRGQKVVLGREHDEERERRFMAFENERQQRAKAALDTAKERGLDLPPVFEKKDEASVDSIKNNPKDIGKGMFEGW